MVDESESDVADGIDDGQNDDASDDAAAPTGGEGHVQGDGPDEGEHHVDVDVSDLTAREEAALRRVRVLSRLLDDAIPIPGTGFRVGLDPILGIAPVGGDAVAAALSLYPVAEAYRMGASRGMVAKMLALVAIDAVVGSVPVLGVIFDAFWKANEWNLRSLERHLDVA